MGILEEGISAGTVTTFMDSMYLMLIWFAVLIVVGIIAYYIYLMTLYKHKARLREITNGVTIVKDTTARESKDKDGLRYWKTWRGARKLPIPPAEAISVTAKGKKVVDAWILETGEVSYCIDKGPQLGKFDSFTTNQRLLLIDEIKKAQTYKKNDWKEHIPMIASMSVLVIIFVVALTYWGDIVAPAQEVQVTNLEIVKQQSKIMDTLQEMVQNKQIFKEETPPE